MASFDLTWGLTIFGILNFFALAGGEMFLFEVTDSEFEESVSDGLLMSGTSSLGLLRPVKKEISVHFFWIEETEKKATSTERTIDKEFIKIKEIYDNFATSNFFYNLSKEEKRKYNKTFFNEYFETNIFLRGFYAERCNNIRSVIKGWKLKIENENDDEL